MKITKKRIRRAVKEGVEATCEKCNDYCYPLNCKYFLKDITQSVFKEITHQPRGERMKKYHISTDYLETLCGLGGGRYRNNLRVLDFRKLRRKDQCKRCNKIWRSGKSCLS